MLVDHKDCAVLTTGKVITLGMTLGVDRGPAQMGEMEMDAICMDAEWAGLVNSADSLYR